MNGRYETNPHATHAHVMTSEYIGLLQTLAELKSTSGARSGGISSLPSALFGWGPIDGSSTVILALDAPLQLRTLKPRSQILHSREWLSDKLRPEKKVLSRSIHCKAHIHTHHVFSLCDN